ncbi:hypothetical protein BaRGS_00023865, partial [Batillaria attramentaria]
MQSAAVHSRCEMVKALDGMIQAETCTQAAAVHSRWLEVPLVQKRLVRYNEKGVRRRLQYTAGVMCKIPRPSGTKGLVQETCMQAAAVHRQLQYTAKGRSKMYRPAGVHGPRQYGMMRKMPRYGTHGKIHRPVAMHGQRQYGMMPKCPGIEFMAKYRPVGMHGPKQYGMMPKCPGMEFMAKYRPVGMHGPR